MTTPREEMLALQDLINDLERLRKRASEWEDICYKWANEYMRDQITYDQAIQKAERQIRQLKGAL